MAIAHMTNKLPESNDSDSADRVVTVLAISPLEEDHVVLRNIFSHSNWRLRSARTWREAESLLRAHTIPVVLCEAHLPDALWTDVLAGMESVTGRPLIIVTARTADEHLWAEVLNLGGYDVLMKPFDQTEIVRVISLAWLNWKHRRESISKSARTAVLRTLAVGA